MREKPTLRMPKLSVEQRFWAKVDKDGPVPDYRPELGPCWSWAAGRNGCGYGTFRAGGRMVYAHRFAYELLVGPITPGLQVDHLCRARNCVNPAHMEPVTQQENFERGLGPMAIGRWQRAKTHCPAGHSYDVANIYWYKGRRYCRPCHRGRRRVAG